MKKISVISKKSVQKFDPAIRKPYFFRPDLNLKHFLLTKLINAEYATLKCPAFSKHSENIIDDLLQDLKTSLDKLNIEFTNFDLNSIKQEIDPFDSLSFFESIYSNTNLDDIKNVFVLLFFIS